MNHHHHPPNHHDQTDVVIVGAGPIGIELAVALQRRGISFQILEAGVIGQTMSWWAPQTRWFSSNDRISIAGVPLVTPDQSKASREQYLTYLRSVVMQFGIQVRSGEKVIDVTRSAGPEEETEFELMTETAAGSNHFRCKKLVLAIGGTDFPRKLGIEGEDLPHVDGYLRETHRYFGRRVMIIGGRNSAIEAALRLHHVGAHVSLSYRGEALPDESIKYWLRPEINGLIKSGQIESHFAKQPIRITPTHVVLRDVNRPDVTREVAVDDVLSLIGYEQDKSLLRNVGVDLIGETLRPNFDEATMESNVPGVYVAGTAVAGTQNSRYKTFLENCHEHVEKIVSHLTGETTHFGRDEVFANAIAAQPES